MGIPRAATVPSLRLWLILLKPPSGGFFFSAVADGELRYAGADGARERAVLVCGCGRRARLVHAPRLSGGSDVIDKRARFAGTDPGDVNQRASEDCAGLVDGDVSAREHESPDLRRL